MRHLATLAAWATLVSAALGANAMQGDRSFQVGNGVTVQMATVTAAQLGERAIIRFIVVNDGPAQIHLANVTGTIADDIRLMALVATCEVRDIGSIGIGDGETLDLTTGQLWYEAASVRRALSDGETIEVTLNFVDWTAVVPVQVRSSGPDPCRP